MSDTQQQYQHEDDEHCEDEPFDAEYEPVYEPSTEVLEATIDLSAENIDDEGIVEPEIEPSFEHDLEAEYQPSIELGTEPSAEAVYEDEIEPSSEVGLESEYDLSAEAIEEPKINASFEQGLEAEYQPISEPSDYTVEEPYIEPSVEHDLEAAYRADQYDFEEEFFQPLSLAAIAKAAVPVKVSREQLEQYLELEKEIQKMEVKNALVSYDVKKKAIAETDVAIQSMEMHVNKLSAKTQREKSDVDKLEESVKEMLASDYEAKMTKEMEEYLEAMNEEEVAKKELESKRQQKKDLEKEADQFKEEAEKLRDLYERRDDLLSDIFNGQYGSERENELEAEFDELKDKKQRVSVAYVKWTNARVLLQACVNQLCFAAFRWKELYNIPNSHSQLKYNCTTECRNNLVAAIQNIESCQRYLLNITFPYCQPPEVETLRRATNNIYSDMQSKERHMHAFQCYDVTYRRAAALLQWFNNVIDQTIRKDLSEISTRAQRTETELRKERLRLIRDRVAKSGGNLDGLDNAETIPMKDDDEIPVGITVTKPESVDSREDIEEKKGSQTELPPATPVPLSQLAPVPDQEALFGQISNLKEQYQKDTEEFQKMQKLNKARMEQTLQAKRMKRHQRRQMQKCDGHAD